MPAPLPPINITLKMPPTPTSPHTLFDWLPIAISAVSVVATVVLGVVVVVLNNRNAQRLEQLKADIGRELAWRDRQAPHLVEIFGRLHNLKEAFVSITKLNELIEKRERIIAEQDQSIPPLELEDVISNIERAQAAVRGYSRANKIYLVELESLIEKFVRFTDTNVDYDSLPKAFEAYEQANKLFGQLQETILSMVGGSK